MWSWEVGHRVANRAHRLRSWKARRRKFSPRGWICLVQRRQSEIFATFRRSSFLPQPPQIRRHHQRFAVHQTRRLHGNAEAAASEFRWQQHRRNSWRCSLRLGRFGRLLCWQEQTFGASNLSPEPCADVPTAKGRQQYHRGFRSGLL